MKILKFSKFLQKIETHTGTGSTILCDVNEGSSHTCTASIYFFYKPLVVSKTGQTVTEDLVNRLFSLSHTKY